ncbi:LOW QUALITY PROTEIN: uncharacterized protein znf318 [Erpetoichthys calabaricus]|uniref:LOW QUALITY PROTEIN: uncharacterized protein znf318 n=1 Tax=Erpetoichthys calabaricus TaxID=27687 RepID=UPI00223457B8|nr:LOW QUALITY PROTEIN: uncharacterized protein znf318 [Erpetoichthys calabaricus]
MFQTRPPRDKERRRDRYRESEGHQRQLSPRDAVHRQPASPAVYRDDRDRHHYISSGYQSSKPYRRPSPGRRHSSPGRNLLDYRGGGPAGRDFTSSPTHSCIPVDHNLIITVGNNSSHSGSPEHRRVDPHELTHGSNVYSRDGLEEDYGRRYSSHDRSGIDYRRGSPHYSLRLNEESRGRSREREKYKNDRYSSKEPRQDPYDMDHDDRSYSSERSRHSERTAERSQRSRSRGRCRGRSRSRSRSPYGKNASDGFRELEMARKRKEQEEMEKLEKEIAQRDSGGPTGYEAQGRSVEISDFGQARLDGTLHMPKKSILKKRVETEGDFSFTDENNDFTSGTTKAQTSNAAMETDRFLHVLNKGIDASLFSALIKEARRQSYSQNFPRQPPETSEDHCENLSKDEDPQKTVDNINEFLLPHERASQDGSGFSRILGMMGDFSTPQEKSQTFPDIEDEEKFLYGDEDEEPTESPILSHSLPVVNIKPSQPEVGLFQELHSQISTQQLSQLQPENVGTLKNKHLESQTLGTWHPNKESPPSIIHLKETSPLRSHQPLNQSVLGHYQESTSNVSHHQENKRNSHSQETIKCSRTVTSPYTSVLPEESKDLSMVKPENVGDHNQETQEYEKIQNLLKTIGLDFGVSEISNLATRIRERLHGKKPQPTALRVYEKMKEKKAEVPTNWEKPRRPSETRSSEIEYNNSVSASSARRSSHNENISSSGLDYSAEKGCNIPVLGESATQPPPIPVASVAITSSSAQPVSSVSVTPSFPVEPYSQYVPMMPPSTFPMPSYEHYNSYMPYPPQSWSIYSTPPPLPPPPPPIQGSIPSIPQPSTFPVLSKKEEQSLKSCRPFLRVIETVPIENKAELKKEESSLVQVPIVESFQHSSSSSIVVQQQKVAEEKNKATEKQKVIEEREKLRKEKESRLKRKEYLMKELERLRKQQGELLRKKRREKDGHKDPLLTEVSRLQEEVMQQISVIRKEHEEAEKKRAQLDKVAQILGLHISEKSKKVVKERENIPEKNREKSPSPEKSSYTCSGITTVTTTTITANSAGPASSNKESKLPSKLPSAKIKSAKTVPPQFTPKSLEQYEYYDAGNHWCKNCNTLYGSMFDFFTHLHSKAHRKTQDPYDRPWAAKTSNTDGKLQTGKNMEKIVVPAKGSEFLTSVIGFYCLLCEKFYGDQIAAEEHVSCHDHNEKYKKYIEENPLYEQRRNLDRQAGLAAVMDNKERRQTEMKRKMVEESGSVKGEDVKAKIVIKEDTEEPDSPMESEDKAVLQKLDSTFKPLVQMKLKKKPEETVKPVTGVKMFGKFNWKKEQKEEEKKETPVEDIGDESKEKEDGKAQLGKAKPIAIRLSGKTIIPQTTAWTRNNSTPALSSQAKIRPNLPLPAMVLRKSSTAAVGKPAPLNAFLSIKSSGNSASKPLPVIKSESKKDIVLTPDLISKAFGGEEVVLKVPPGTEDQTQTPTETKLPQPPPPPPVLQVMSFESDVAAPGVPESEQTRTMLVRPPPLCGASTMKTEKPKSSLATANAKDLYDIFYSSGAKSSCDLIFVSTDQDTIKEDKPEIKETKTDVPSRNEKNADLDQVSKSVGSESDANTEDNLTLIKTGSVSVKESENQMEPKEIVNVGESCCADPVPFVSDVNAVESESSLPPLEDENLLCKPLITSADNPADENNASDFGNSEISISPVPEIKVDDIPFQSEVEESTLVLRHDVSLNSDIHMDEPDSLDSALQSNVFCDQETSDHFENDFMPSDGKAYTFNLEDNDQDQSACFKEISTVHQSVDLEVSSDEPETIRLEMAEKEVSLVEQSSFEVLSLNLSSADLNLDTYDIGFETTDLSVSEATNESVPMETEKSNDETCGIPLDTAELNISEIVSEFVPVETENTRGKTCNEDFETADLNEIANELVPIESEEPSKTCDTGFDNADLNVPSSENEPPTKEADLKNDEICGNIFKTENVNDSEMEKQPLLEEVLKANDSTGGPAD